MTSSNDKKISNLDHRMKIDQEFLVTVEKAQALYDSKRKPSTTNKVIDEAHDAFKTTLKHATQTRKDAILDLGPVPFESNYRAAC